MIIRVNRLLLVAAVLSLAACQSKDKSKSPPTATPEALTPTSSATPSIAPSAAPQAVSKPVALSTQERAAKLGFARHLSQDTEVLMTFHHGLESKKRLTDSRLWKLLEAQNGPSPKAVKVEDPNGPEALLGTEFTIALGKAAGTQTANLLTVNRRMGYFQMRMLAKAFAASAKSGDLASIQHAFSNQYSEELFKDLLADPESGIGLVERLNMPSIFLAFRTSDDARAGAERQLASLVANLTMLGDMVAPVEVENVGKKFQGMQISGAKISAMMQESRESMAKTLEPVVLDKLFAAIAKKNLVMLSGTLGDYAVLFIGSSVDDLKFAPSPTESLVASEALAFCDAYASKDLAAVICGQKAAMAQLAKAAGGLADMAAGLRDGLSGSAGLGDTRDLEALLRMVGERESALRQLSSYEAVGIAAFFDQGLKIESYGGTDNGAIDWKVPNKLAALGDADDVVMFANMTTEAAYDEKAHAYLEALMETSYALAMKVAEFPVKDPQMAQFTQMAKMFDTQFRPDAVALWDAFSGDFGGALGKERACVVDLNGAVPALPGLPSNVVDQGKFPRISIVAPVADRAKLAASWQTMNTSITAILAKISEMTGQQIPMQKPISSDKNGFTTWFFALPFFSDDFIPSVTVGDKWFAASTSKNQALDLVNKAAKNADAPTGLCFTLNFKALQKFSRETFKLLGEDAQGAKGVLGAQNIPAAKMKNARDFIDALDDLDKLSVHIRREGGVMRSSTHFKTR